MHCKIDIVVVTNQSGIARGLYTEQDLARIHEELHDRLDRLPLAYIHCPHHPDYDNPYGRVCDCRKPGPGLLHQAQPDQRLDRPEHRLLRAAVDLAAGKYQDVVQRYPGTTWARAAQKSLP